MERNKNRRNGLLFTFENLNYGEKSEEREWKHMEHVDGHIGIPAIYA